MISLKNLLLEGPFSSRMRPSGYQNVTWGDGIVGNSRPSQDDINPSLLKDVETAAVAAGVNVTITTAVSGHRSGTRHNPAGNAVDIAVVNGYGYGSKRDAKKKGIYDAIMDFVAELENLGYKKNRERGNDKAVLTFGFPDHQHHIHVSRRSREDDEAQRETPESETKLATGDLSYGDEGPEVRDMQQRIIYVMDDPLAVGPPQDDGIFGPYTENGLIAFQKDKGLTGSGVYDEETKNKLESLTADVSAAELSNIKPVEFDVSNFDLSDSVVNQATDLLKRFEGFEATPQWDVNNWRIGHGSNTITKPDGTVIHLGSDESIPPTETVTREDAARDLKRRLETEFIPKKVMPWVSADTPDGVIAALTSVAYNYGSLPKSVIQALNRADGDYTRVADAVRALETHNAGINKTRRNKEADYILAVIQKDTSYV